MLNVEGPVTIYLDTDKAVRALRRRSLFLFPVLVLFITIISIPLREDPLIWWALNLLYILEIPLLYFFLTRKLRRTTRPILSISSLGITVDTLGNRIGFLRWDEIEEIYSYWFIYRFVGIKLRHPNSVYQRIGLKRSWLPRLTAMVIPFYKPFGIRVAPINIPQKYVPMQADELVKLILEYRTTYS